MGDKIENNSIVELNKKMEEEEGHDKRTTTVLSLDSFCWKIFIEMVEFVDNFWARCLSPFLCVD